MGSTPYVPPTEPIVPAETEITEKPETEEQETSSENEITE